MKLSIVIPTYNRSDILFQCLNCLDGQSFSKDEFEVIVVDDGSSDDTSGIVRKAQDKFSVKIIYLHQKNQGQGIARNLGLSEAKGEIVMFIGDDILVEKDFAERHMAVHEKYPEENVGVLGFIDWHSSLNITPFMKWLTNGSSVFGRFGGHQFAFEKLVGKKWADFNFFYTSNISLKKSLLEKHSFDPLFKGYGWEDIELGYRLTKEENFRLSYEPRAVGHHLHLMNEESLAPRMRMIGKSAWLIHEKYPELGKVPSRFKRLVFKVLGSGVVIFVLNGLSSIAPKAKVFYFYALSKRYFMEGLTNGASVG